jgi:putative aminopeptidase FrvX
MIKKEKEGHTEWGKGPVISYAPSIHHQLRDHIITQANEYEIPFQRMANSTYTGTDTDAFAYSNDGTPSALISLPLRYMHTTVEMARREDVQHTIQLMYQSIVALQWDEQWKYL